MTTRTSHLERTAHEPRDESLHTLLLSHIDQVNPSIRVLRLQIPPGAPAIKFLPGQWLDTFCPGVPKAGGFTITSTPSRAAPTGAGTGTGYLELAVQRSPDNPAAQWLWQDSASIIGQEIRVRIGGSFVYPPPSLPASGGGGGGGGPVSFKRVVFVAGGVGVNPLVSMACSIAEQQPPPRQHRPEVHFLYSLRGGSSQPRDPTKMLFVERIAELFTQGQVRGEFRLFLTRAGAESEQADDQKEQQEQQQQQQIGVSAGALIRSRGYSVPVVQRRLDLSDIVDAVGGPEGKDSAIVYVCGVPGMTDQIVKELTSLEGLDMDPRRVLSEKWW